MNPTIEFRLAHRSPPWQGALGENRLAHHSVGEGGPAPYSPANLQNERDEVLPILLSIPHASAFMPEEVKKFVKLDDKALLDYVDLYSDQIYRLRGYHILEGKVCRVFVDVNRAPDDIAKEYAKGEEGVVVHTTHDGTPVYGELPSEALMNTLVEKYHTPYHDAIDLVIPHLEFLFDCHSYLPVGPKMKKDAGKPRPDFNIGNRSYSTCNREHTMFIRDFFKKRGYSVGINVPYMGGYVLAHHCHRRRIPPFLVPGMQLEISQSLYVDSKTLQPIPGNIEKMNALMQEMVDTFYEHFFQKQSKKT